MVVEVATAVPAFIGYTERADHKGQPLTGTPWRIASFAEYQAHFGGAPLFSFRIDDDPTRETRSPGGAFTCQGRKYRLTRTDGCHLLHHSMQLFFQNGGGACYIVSVGGYDARIGADALKEGIDRLLREKEPTLLIVPDAVRLELDDCISVQRAAVEHCSKVHNRFAILDVWRGHADRHDVGGDPVAAFRAALSHNRLDLAAAYYPWVNTTVVQDGSLGVQNVENADESLVATSPLFKAILEQMTASVNLLPPAAAMAGVYTLVDTSRGVWKAPANVSLAGVISPAVSITQDEQADLNVSADGRAVNAIRSFVGEGTLVWGARTLDGNSLDWRYINVRRTALMLEASIRLAMTAYEREPNETRTWATLKGSIGDFLTGLWRRGALAGSSAEDAFSVHVGLGDTMTAEDIVNGILRLTVLVALTRPAEFIELTFQLQMHSH